MITIQSQAQLREWLHTIYSIYDEVQHRIPSVEEVVEWIVSFSNGTTGEQMREVAKKDWAALQPVVPPFAPLPRLRVRGHCFERETSERFTAIQNSDFSLLRRFQAGEDINPILAQRSEIGFNLLRVWTRYQGWSIGGGEPGFTDIDYSRVPAFMDLCARHALYAELVGYAGTRLRYEDDSTTWPDDHAHWPQLVASVQGRSNVLLELVNEADQPANRLVHFAEYQRPVGVLASHGSNGSETWPVLPYWSYAGFHTNDAFEEQRKIGHNAMEIWDGPTLTGETSRFPEVGMWAGANLYRQKQLAYDSAAGGALLPAGSCWHSVAGKVSRLFVGDEIEVARSWVAGAKSPDLSQQDAPYEHLIDQEGANDLRVYRRGTAVVDIRK